MEYIVVPFTRGARPDVSCLKTGRGGGGGGGINNYTLLS